LLEGARSDAQGDRHGLRPVVHPALGRQEGGAAERDLAHPVADPVQEALAREGQAPGPEEEGRVRRSGVDQEAAFRRGAILRAGMPAHITHEGGDIFRLDVSGTLSSAELDAAGKALLDGMQQAAVTSVRLVVVLRDFAGWDAVSNWSNLTFY